ncbi:Zinc finger C2H2 [Penicillium cf. viridicatum]|uniref:Zinc finger C2H2 n=1 Tax=Penicillium cf. viridicatum TaxID=2972119 RepID=A0A9W9SYQ7_9EURO|nr:Zinc finger C2H2 [Penicillium cf. viridicatum]
MCGLKPDEEFSKAITRMSCWIDRRRLRYLSDADRELVEKDLELQSAICCITGDARGLEALSL